MQLKASKAKKRIYSRTVADNVCRDFIAQQTNVTDPNMVQPGEVLVDQMGNEMQVVENDPTKQDIVMAPADEQIPEGTTSVPNQEVTQYSIKTDAPANGVTYASKDKIPGGLGDDKTSKDFDESQLSKGIKVELEHTDDKSIAKEIAIDHLTEDPKYYDHLNKMEEKYAGADSIDLETGQGLGSYVENEILQLAPPELVESIKQKYLAEGKSLEDLSEDDMIDLLDDMLDMPINNSYTHSSANLSNDSWTRIAKAGLYKENKGK